MRPHRATNENARQCRAFVDWMAATPVSSASAAAPLGAPTDPLLRAAGRPCADAPPPIAARTSGARRRPRDSSLSPLASTSPRAWHSITARRRHSTCQAVSSRDRPASILRSPPRCPSTSSPRRRCWLCEKPGASTCDTMYALWRWWSWCETISPTSCNAAAQRSSLCISASPSRPRALEEALRGACATRSAWCTSDVEAALELGDRRVAQVVAARLVAGGEPLGQVDDHALAQRALGGRQLVDAELRADRVEDGQAAGDHRAAFGLHAGDVELVDVAQLDAALDQPAQAFGRDAAVGLAAGLQHVGHGARGAGRAQRLAPVAARERHQRLLELGARGHLRGAERGARVAAVGEVAHRQADAADLERFGHARRAAVAQDHLGGAAADVDHQPRLGATAAGTRRRRRSGAPLRGRR